MLALCKCVFRLVAASTAADGAATKRSVRAGQKRFVQRNVPSTPFGREESLRSRLLFILSFLVMSTAFSTYIAQTPSTLTFSCRFSLFGSFSKPSFSLPHFVEESDPRSHHPPSPCGVLFRVLATLRHLGSCFVWADVSYDSWTMACRSISFSCATTGLWIGTELSSPVGKWLGSVR